MISDSFRGLLKYSKKWKFLTIKATTYSVIEKIFDVFPEILIGIAVDLVVNKRESLLGKWGVGDPFHQLICLGIVTAIVWMLESTFEYLVETSWRGLAQEVQHTFRMDAYNHVQKLDMGWFTENSTGDILSTLNGDINELERFISTGANNLIQLTVSSIVITGIFIYLSPIIAFFSMLPIPFILIGSALFQKYLYNRYKLVRDSAGLISSKINNNLQGIATIKSFTAEKITYKELFGLSSNYAKYNKRAFKISSLINPFIRTVVLVGFLVTLVLGGWLTMKGDLAIGAYSALIFLTQRLLWPFRSLGEISDSYQRAMASTNRILNLIKTRIKIQDSPNATSPSIINGEINYDKVDFGYGENYIFKDVSLKINSGEYIGLVGTTGAGKSSLIKLLLRFYDPLKGAIKIDNINIKDINLNTLRKSIGLVNQDPFLFDGTIFDNLSYGLSDIKKSEVIDAAKFAEIHDFINTLNKGYDTQVGERGFKLSGGQRQRICIARALIKNPKILIFDEATSAVDNETEASIQRSLVRLKHSRTMIVIAHRLSTVRFADRIYVLSNKGITEQGTHEELVNKKGVYANLWSIQTGQISQ